MQGQGRPLSSPGTRLAPSMHPYDMRRGADREVVFAGLTLETAKAANVEIVTDAFPFRANGRAMTLASNTGFIRMVARADNHLLLGIQGVGARVPNSRRRSALPSRWVRGSRTSPDRYSPARRGAKECWKRAAISRSALRPCTNPLRGIGAAGDVVHF